MIKSRLREVEGPDMREHMQDEIRQWFIEVRYCKPRNFHKWSSLKKFVNRSSFNSKGLINLLLIITNYGAIRENTFAEAYIYASYLYVYVIGTSFGVYLCSTVPLSSDCDTFMKIYLL